MANSPTVMRRTLAALGVGLLILTSLSALPARSEPSFSSPNMKAVASHKWRSHGAPQMGSDLEFATINGRDYAFAGTLMAGMQIVDITNPRKPQPAGHFDCNIGQGDVQVFRQGSRWLATYTADNGYPSGGACFRQAGAKRGSSGTFIVDVSNPSKPRAIGFLPVLLGSHNITVHPGGRFLYNSDSEFPGRGQVEVWDIIQPAKPKLVRIADLLPQTGALNDLPSSSHDITFNADGSRAYVAALTYSVVLDTTAPGAPKAISWIVDPAITLHHQADPVVLQTPAGPLTFLVVTDEMGGGAENNCPGGGLHVFHITGPLELAPVKVGAFFAPFYGQTPKGACTSHVLRMHPDEMIMTIGWYGLGSRVIDISGLVGLAAGTEEASPINVGAGMREVGYFRFTDSNTWTAKTNRIERDGSFYLYANDLNRGLDVLHYTPPTEAMLSRGPGGIDAGRWLTPAQALQQKLSRSSRVEAAPLAPYCVLPLI